MRTLSFSMVVAFTLVLSGVSMAGSSSTCVPNTGMFAFNAKIAEPN